MGLPRPLLAASAAHLLLRALLASCATWWLLPAAGLCARDAAPARAPGDFRLVVYNVRNYLPMRRGTGDKAVDGAPKPEEEIARVVNILVELSPSAAGLIEMGGEREVADLQGRLRARGVDLPHMAVVRGADEARHVAILSAYPIVENASRGDVRFSLDGRWEMMQRGILDVTLDVPGVGATRMIGVHLKSRRPVPEYDQAAMRMREARELRKHIDAVFEKDSAARVIIWGDFNDTKNEPALRDVAGVAGTEQALRAVDLADSSGDRWTHYWEAADTYSRFDFIFLSKALFPLVAGDASGIFDGPGWNIASDHRPIFLTLRKP